MKYDPDAGFNADIERILAKTLEAKRNALFPLAAVSKDSQTKQENKGTWPLFQVISQRAEQLAHEIAQMELEDPDADAILRRNFMDMRFLYKRNPDGSIPEAYQQGYHLLERLLTLQEVFSLREDDIGPHMVRAWYALQAAAFEVQQDLFRLARYAIQLEQNLRHDGRQRE